MRVEKGYFSIQKNIDTITMIHKRYFNNLMVARRSQEILVGENLGIPLPWNLLVLFSLFRVQSGDSLKKSRILISWGGFF